MPLRKVALAVAAASIAAAPAHAHAFNADADWYGQFLEAAGVVLGLPQLILPIAALGIFLALWDLDGLPKAWPAYLAGQVAGLGLAPSVGPAVAVAPVIVGAIAGIAGALGWPRSRLAALSIAFAMGTAVFASSFEGHGFLALSVYIHVGFLFAANVAVAAVAGLARVTFDASDAAWVRIGWRIAASWLAAILVLFAAFSLAGQGGT